MPVSLCGQDLVQLVHVVVESSVGASLYHGLCLTFWWWEAKFSTPLNIRRIWLKIPRASLPWENLLLLLLLLLQLHLSCKIKFTVFFPETSPLQFSFIFFLQKEDEEQLELNATFKNVHCRYKFFKISLFLKGSFWVYGVCDYSHYYDQ